MKKRNFPLLLILLIGGGMASCGNINKNVASIPAVWCSDRCGSDTLNSYEVFIPEREKADQTLPLLVILDPHGNGKASLLHFKLAAEHYPAVLVASNLVKNNLPGYEDVVQKLIEDVRTKYPVGKVILLSGFSGGARMAIGYAMNHPVNGLILSGALAGPDELRKVGCLVYSISGTDDFNFMETAQYLFQEATIPENLKIEFINTSHGWPDSLTLASAVGFVQLACSETLGLSVGKVLEKDFVKQQTEKIDSFRNQGDLLNSMLMSRNMSTTAPFNNEKSFAASYNALKASPAYAAQMSLLMQNLQFEYQVRQPYLEALQTKNTEWWKKELVKIDLQIQTATTPFARDANRRIKAFFGIACYSYCRQASQSHNATALNQVLPIYRMLEPENPDMFYFSAIAKYWEGSHNDAKFQLKKAIDAGFSDLANIHRDMPALTNY